MAVTNLFIKPMKKASMVSVEEIECTPPGIFGNIDKLPLRQVLITQKSILRDLGINPGELRENMTVDFDGLHNLPSGTVIMIGEVPIRLTFHCEPCGVVLEKLPHVKFKQILHLRGVFGTFLDDGKIKLGDTVSILKDTYEEIPYEISDRVRWYLDKQQEKVRVEDLLFHIGLSPAYARAVPSYLKKLPPRYTDMVVYKTGNRRHTI